MAISIFKFIGLSTTPQQVKGTGGTSQGGQLFFYHNGNSSAIDVWVKWYDMQAAPTVGTTIPVFSFYVPKGTGQAEASIQDAIFFNGIWVAATGGILDTDTTATTANTVVVNATYR